MLRKGKTFMFILLVTALHCHAQHYNPVIYDVNCGLDREPGGTRMECLDSLYVTRTASERSYVNGAEYLQYYFRSLDNPVYRSRDEVTATLFSGCRRYDDMFIQYDTFKDQLILIDRRLIYENQVCLVALNNNDIQRVILKYPDETLDLKYFRSADGPLNGITEGYYEVVHDGKTSYIIKHISTKHTVNAVDEYDYKPQNYVRIGNEYARISSRKKFLLLFGDKSDEVRQYMHKNRIRIRYINKSQMALILDFYERL